MNYGEMTYKSLQSLAEGLKNLIVAGEKSSDIEEQLKLVETELAQRTWRLCGEYDGREVAEYDRLRTEDKCKQMARAMGLPIGADLRLDGRPFRIKAERVTK
jgi:hypothetical protein